MINGVIMQYFNWYTPGDGTHWLELAARSRELAKAGFTALWLPPAYKGHGGAADVGYGVYDMYDLGEFEQKGSIRTKYGTKAQLMQALAALRAAGLQVYADTVFNHRMGADETEDVPATPFPADDRLHPRGPERTIRSWSRFTFPGRKGAHSAFEWNHRHFDAVDHDALRPDEHNTVYLFSGKVFDDQVALENGNYAYLMGCDLDCQSPETRAELEAWGKWFLDTCGVDGFRLDAVKHIAAWFFPQWIDAMEKHAGRPLFAVGEYWNSDTAHLDRYLDLMQHRISLFDVHLHYNFHNAGRAGGRCDMRRIFDGSLVARNPAHAVTFVENHDSQPLQSLESCVEPWFKPLAYALILLREAGYPCVFEADYYGTTYEDKGRDGNLHRIDMPSHRFLIDRFLWARKHYAHGPQLDWFDHFNRVGWTRLGTAEHPHAMAVLLSDGPPGSKWMDVKKPGAVFVDICGHDPLPVVANADGWGEFRTPGGSLSVWVERGKGAPEPPWPELEAVGGKGFEA